MDRAALVQVIQTLLDEKGRALVALEGMSASGKTTLAAALATVFCANVYHMDDFFLPADLRRPDWQQIPAGNMDMARFAQEVLKPLIQGEEVAYRPYRCQDGVMGARRIMPPRPLQIVEGAYCTHPALGAPYDLTLFVTVDPAVQRQRILARNGMEGLKRFEQIWIPMEQRYFTACDVKRRCNIQLTL